MFDSFFLQMLNMSFAAVFVIVPVLLIRLLLKKAPTVFSYALWAVVLFRLVCPFSFESALSLLPVNASPIPSNILQTQAPQINTGLSALDLVINPVLPSPEPAVIPTAGAAANQLQIWVIIGECVWLVGLAALLLYSVISLILLRKRLVGSVKLHDDIHKNIYFADHISTPFVFGVFRPRIYLPSTLFETEQNYIIAHEQTHIRRCDPLLKLIAFLVLAMHWFNPLVWLSFILFCKDMEMSCDESVMKQLGTDIRQEYSASLLGLATGRKIISGAPLAFGEGNMKGRIRNVMSYKKPAIWLSAVAVVVIIATCVGLLANPPKNTPKTQSAESDTSLLTVSEASSSQYGNTQGYDIDKSKVFRSFSAGENLKLSAIMFPAYQEGKQDYNAHLYESGPFILTIGLPEHWMIVPPPPEERGKLNIEGFTPLRIIDDDLEVGTISFNLFEEPEGLTPDDPNYYRAVYSQLNSNHSTWDIGYTPVRQQVPSTYVATCMPMVSIPQEDVAAAAWETYFCPGVLAYNTDTHFYVMVKFKPMVVSESDLTAIAQSILLGEK